MIKTLSFTALLTLALTAAAQAQAVRGQVKKIDAASGRVTIDHGPIKKLDMDAMSMVFRMADPAMLKNLKEGDRIQFDADRINGAFTVTKMRKVK